MQMLFFLTSDFQYWYRLQYIIQKLKHFYLNEPELFWTKIRNEKSTKRKINNIIKCLNIFSLRFIIKQTSFDVVRVERLTSITWKCKSIYKSTPEMDGPALERGNIQSGLRMWTVHSQPASSTQFQAAHFSIEYFLITRKNSELRIEKYIVEWLTVGLVG